MYHQHTSVLTNHVKQQFFQDLLYKGYKKAAQEVTIGALHREGNHSVHRCHLHSQKRFYFLNMTESTLRTTSY